MSTGCSRPPEDRCGQSLGSNMDCSSCLEEAILQLKSHLHLISDESNIVRMRSFLKGTGEAFKLVRQEIDSLREKVSFYEEFIRDIDQELWTTASQLFRMKGTLSVEGIVKFVEQEIFGYTWSNGNADVTNTRTEIWRSGLEKCTELKALYQRFEGFDIESVPELVASAVDRCKSRCLVSSVHGLQTTALVLDPGVLSLDEMRVIFAIAVFLHLECRIGRFEGNIFIEDCVINLDKELYRDEPFEKLDQEVERHTSQLKSVVPPERETWPVDVQYKYLKKSGKLEPIVSQKLDEVYNLYIENVDKVRQEVISETPMLMALKDLFERMLKKRRELTTAVWIAKGILTVHDLIDQALFCYSRNLADGMLRKKGPNGVLKNWQVCVKSAEIRKFLRDTGLSAEELPQLLQDVHSRSVHEAVADTSKLMIRKNITGNDQRVAALLKMFANEFHLMSELE